MEQESKSSAAVYVSWITFLNALTFLSHGVPAVLDKSLFPGMSGGVQNQLMAALKFLGLISESGQPTSDLSELATQDEQARKTALARILNQRYSAIVRLDLSKATPAQLNETIASAYGVSGDTKEKAVRFFLSAAQYAGIPLSRFLLQAKSAPASTPRKRRAGPRGRDSEIPDDATDDDTGGTPADAGPSRTISLASGGTITVSASIDVFKLSPSDRAFVFGLIDKLAEYKKDDAT